VRCEVPLGHADTIRNLWKAADGGRLPHALLFAGPDGVGKFLSAQWLTFGLLCAEGPGEPCGTCGPCKRLLVDSHPDVYVLDPVEQELETILVKHIAPRSGENGPNVLDSLSLRPMEGGWRIVIVREAHRMNTSAQNALLKTLEEPGAHALLVLETAHQGQLLPTVRSRCSNVSFDALAPDATQSLLARNGVDASEVERLAAWSGGAPGRALTLAARGAAGLRELLAGVLDGTRDPLDALAEAAQAEGDFGGGTARQIARERARTFLDLALAVLADAQRALAGVEPGALAHGDLVASLPQKEGRIVSLLEAGLLARQDVEANLAPDAVLEEFLLALAPLRVREVTR
jgi:DNA polymerase-3 subunit delta'